MIEIIKHKIGNSEIYSVDGRELHKKLEIKKRFADWIKYQIKSLRLVENLDFTSFHKNVKREIGSTKTTEYFLTLEIAKHIAMASRTNKGFEIRNYFIEVEKRFKETSSVLTESKKIDLQNIITESKHILELIHLFENESIVNLVKLDRFMKRKSNISPLKLIEMDFSDSYFIPTEFGKILGKTPFEINQLLADKGFQFKENGVWRLKEKGEDFGIAFQNGAYPQIKWKLESLI